MHFPQRKAPSLTESAEQLLAKYGTGDPLYEAAVIIDGKYAVIETVRALLEFRKRPASGGLPRWPSDIANNAKLIAACVQHIACQFAVYAHNRSIDLNRHPHAHDPFGAGDPIHTEWIRSEEGRRLCRADAIDTKFYFAFGRLAEVDAQRWFDGFFRNEGRALNTVQQQTIKRRYEDIIIGNIETSLPAEDRHFGILESTIWNVASVLERQGVQTLLGKRKLYYSDGRLGLGQEKQVDPLILLTMGDLAHDLSDYLPTSNRTPRTEFIGLITDDSDFVPHLAKYRSETFYLDVLSMRPDRHAREICDALGFSEHLTVGGMVEYLEHLSLRTTTDLLPEFALIHDVLSRIEGT